MSIKTWTSIGARPEPSIFTFFNSFQEKFANLKYQYINAFFYLKINIILFTMSVVGCFLSFSPCFLFTTSFSFSSSQLSILSFSSPSRISTYMLLFSAFFSVAKSCENLHFEPFAHWPCLKNAHRMDFGSAPDLSIHLEIKLWIIKT